MLDTVEELLSHRRSYFSQSGEDGLLEFILSRIFDKTKWCVEFGAWDGQHWSNTFHFISRHGYKGILIEGDPCKFKVLKEKMELYDVLCLNKLVVPEGADSLGNILRQTSIPNDFDLLSVDIDSDDYQIWESLQNYDPKGEIIEVHFFINPVLSG